MATKNAIPAHQKWAIAIFVSSVLYATVFWGVLETTPWCPPAHQLSPDVWCTLIDRKGSTVLVDHRDGDTNKAMLSKHLVYGPIFGIGSDWFEHPFPLRGENHSIEFAHDSQSGGFSLLIDGKPVVLPRSKRQF